MTDVFLIVLPVFLVLGAGYGLVRTGWLDGSVADQLNAYSVRLGVPVFLFAAMVRVDLGRAFDARMLAGFYLGAVACFVTGALIAAFVWKLRPGEAVSIGFTAMFSNTVLLGLPILERAYGPDALTPAFGIVALHAPGLYALGIITMELVRRDGKTIAGALAAALRAILGNALMIGILAGLAVNLSGLALPAPVMAAFAMVAASAVPVALIGIGAALTRYSLKAGLSETLILSALPLVLHPLVAFLVTHVLFGLGEGLVSAAVVIAAMPPGMNTYVFAVLYGRGEKQAASTILVATMLSVITIPLWLMLLRSVFSA